MSRYHLHLPRSAGERVADRFAAVVGSWRFIIVQSCVLAAWITLNVVGLVRHWDGYPFILCNLALSFQAAYTGPILLMAANRQSAIDRRRDDQEAGEVDEILMILRELQQRNEAS